MSDKRSITRPDFRHKTKIALSIFLPLVVLANGILWMSYRKEAAAIKHKNEIHVVNTLKMQRLKIGSNFSLIVSDLMFFSKYSQLLDFLENEAPLRSRLVNDFVLFSRGSKIYDQIRILDQEGMEVIRINFVQGNPVIIPEDKLQFKGERYYFKDTIELTQGDVFVSAFDLNIERGKIELPIKPMIRFGTPIFDRQGEKRGIILFNYLGAHLLKDFKDLVIDSPGHYMLLNCEGYWLIGRETKDEWGFMYKDRKDRTMGNDYPTVWDQITASDSGQFYTPEGLFTFTTVHPLLESWKSSTGAGEAFAPSARMKKAQEQYWTVVSFIPADFLAQGARKVRSRYTLICIMITVLLGIGSFVLATVRAREKLTGQALAARTVELEQANVKLQELGRLKSQFFANMSHELRTPLNSIIGFTGIMLQGIVGELNDEQKKQLNMVYASAKHLLGLINDILDLSKIEAGKIEIIPSRFEVKELVQTVEKMVSPIIEEKGLTSRVVISEDVPQTIYSDKNRIKQVLINFLSNAIKFTESGEVCLTVRILDLKQEVKEPAIEFSVTDTGIGIKPEHLPDIFDEFRRIEGPLKDKPAGTGLGLAISRKMADMMGGRIWAESEYGKGSCFRFTIPIKEITEAKIPPVISPEALDLSKKLVLTIDDEVEAQEIIKTYLKTEGYEVIQAYNAMEAMELTKKYHPFAITLDIVMSGKDGWDILHELKKDAKTKDIPIICISMLDNREMGISLGAIEYMVKPINKDQLMEELQRLEKRFGIYDILIIDDEPQAVELLTQYLGEEGNYMVRKAYGAEEGLSRVKESRPDLIILDLMMPEVDGFEVIRNLKKSEETKEIPIIIVSAKKLTQEEIEYLNNNIEKIIRKGDFSKEELLEDIKRALDTIED